MNFNKSSPISLTNAFLPGKPVLPSFINLISNKGICRQTSRTLATGCQHPQHIQNGPMNTYKAPQKKPSHQPNTRKSISHSSLQQHVPHAPISENIICRNIQYSLKSSERPLYMFIKPNLSSMNPYQRVIQKQNLRKLFYPRG